MADFFVANDINNIEPINADNIPVGIVKLRYTGDNLIIENANKTFYFIAHCFDVDFKENQKDDYRSIIIDEDWEKLKEKLDYAIERDFDKICCEYRVFNPKGVIFWRKINAFKMKTNCSEGTEFLCALTDITDEKNTQAELEKEKESYLAIANLVNVNLFEYDIEKDIMLDITNGVINRKLEDYSTNIKNYDVFVGSDDICDVMTQKLRSGDKEFYIEVQIRNALSKTEWFGIWGKTLFDEQGKPLKVIGQTKNIDVKKRRDALFKNRKNFDNLTGLYNIEYAKKIISERLKENTKTMHALIAFDIDNFTKLNLDFSKNFCDAVLLNISQRIKLVFSDDDILARVSGDEFLVYVDKLKSEDELKVMLDKINLTFESIHIDDKHQKCILGSIGASIIKPNETDIKKIFEKVAYSLYVSKSEDKNKYHIFQENDYEPFEKRIQKYSDFNEIFRYKKAIQDEKEFNYEITEFAFDIMESTSDVNVAINILLDKVGRYFNLSRILIYTPLEYFNKFEIDYEWCNDNILPLPRDIQCIPKEDMAEFLYEYQLNDVFIYSEYPGFEKGLKFKEYIGSGTKSNITYLFKEKGHFKGYISFSDSKNRIWGQNEIASLKMIGKIISAYLLKMRAFKEASDTVKKLNKYDTVTGVMKYERFKIEVEKALISDPNSQYAIIYSDITNFKYINERYGYMQGDEVLRSFVKNMDRSKCEVFIVGRMFSDNFVTLIKLNDKINKDNLCEYVDGYARRFIEAEKEDYDEVKIGVTTGIYLITEITELIDKEYVNRIIDKANTARRYCKTTHSDKAILFDSNMENKMRKQVEILTSMEKALLNHEFVIFLQPKVELKGKNNIVGAEALVRWIKSDGKIIPPMDFIPIFEKNGFVVNVDFCVYEQVCEFLSQRIKEGKKVVPVSVNVSRVHLEKEDFVERIDNLVTKYNIPRHLLEFELTENILFENADKAISVMNRLREMNFTVSMDDFGSGYSSLNLLKKLPVDVLKMDRGFLDNEEVKGNDEIVIKSIIEMAKKMQITVLCEGVETEKQAKFLQNAGCDLAQGYYFSRPVKVDEFKEMLNI